MAKRKTTKRSDTETAPMTVDRLESLRPMVEGFRKHGAFAAGNVLAECIQEIDRQNVRYEHLQIEITAIALAAAIKDQRLCPLADSMLEPRDDDPLPIGALREAVAELVDLRQLVSAQADIKAGRIVSHEQVLEESNEQQS